MYHRIGVVQYRVIIIQPVDGCMAVQFLQVAATGSQVDRQACRMIGAGRIVGVNVSIGIDKCLQAGQIRITVSLVVNFNADVEGACNAGCI